MGRNKWIASGFGAARSSVFGGLALLVVGYSLSLSAMVSTVQAQCTPAQVEQLTATGGQGFDDFGRSMAVSGEWAVIASTRDDDNGTDSGSATMFHFDGTEWVEGVKLLAPDGSAGDEFGSAVAIDGDLVVVGAWKDQGIAPVHTRGSVYVFRYNGASWDFEARIAASDGSGIVQDFGIAVGIGNGRVVVGAPGDNTLYSSSAGSVYTYRYTGGIWGAEVKISATDGSVAQYFGATLAVAGGTVLIGAYGDNEVAAGAGAAYLYTTDTGQLMTKLQASDGVAYDGFGRYLAMSGDTAVVYGKNYGGTSGGAVYVFDYDGSSWAESGKIVESFASTSYNFGWGVAVSGDKILVRESYKSKVYLFLRSGSQWSDEGTLVPTGTGYGLYGARLAFSGDTALVGDQRWNNGGVKSGTVFVFDLNCPVAAASPELPDGLRFSMHQNVPNPFNPATVLSFELPTRSQVNLTVFDLAGRHVTTLVRETREAGHHRVTWNGRDDAGQAVSAGIYFYRLEAGGLQQTRRMMLIK